MGPRVCSSCRASKNLEKVDREGGSNRVENLSEVATNRSHLAYIVLQRKFKIPTKEFVRTEVGAVTRTVTNEISWTPDGFDKSEIT